VPGLRLKLVCDRFLRLDHLPVVEVPWARETEAAALATADVGVSWIPDDEWSRGKCGLKVLQYMAAGLPVIANPVGVHPEIVRNGATGYLAATPGEWLVAVATLAAEPWLRHRMGQVGRQRLEAGYSVAAGARRWLDLLERLDGRTARTA
jgi:glycosyltransferase involved in cell wall biosynthesis